MISSWRNLLARRDLLRQLVLSEIRMSTAETRLGWAWWLLDPTLQMLIYWAIVVGIFGRGRAEYAPYPVFVLCGLVCWKHFAHTATRCTRVLAANAALIRAVPFPTIVLPLSQVLGGALFLCMGLLVVGAAALIGGGANHSGDLLPLVQVPAFVVLQLFVVAGITIPLACFGAVLRDTTALVAHMTRIGFYLSPGLFGVDLVQAALRERLSGGLADALFGVYMLNPFAILIHGYRRALFHGEFLGAGHWAVLVVEAAILFFLGCRLYQRFDRRVLKFL